MKKTKCIFGTLFVGIIVFALLDSFAEAKQPIQGTKVDAQECPQGQVMTGIDEDGMIICSADNTGGTGAAQDCTTTDQVVAGVDATGNVSCGGVNADSCMAGKVVTGINSNGTVSCEDDMTGDAGPFGGKVVAYGQVSSSGDNLGGSNNWSVILDGFEYIITLTEHTDCSTAQQATNWSWAAETDLMLVSSNSGQDPGSIFAPGMITDVLNGNPAPSCTDFDSILQVGFRNNTTGTQITKQFSFLIVAPPAP